MYAVVLGTSLQEDALGIESCEWERTKKVVEEGRVDVHEFLGIRPGTRSRLGLWLEVGVEEHNIDVLDLVFQSICNV